MNRIGYPGWSLIETVIGMAIVFTLTAGVGYVGSRQIESARRLAARREIAVYEAALEGYHLDCGRYPTEAQGLQALWELPYLAPIPDGWNGPYLRRAPVPDPWGAEYAYTAPGPSGLPYLITSATLQGSDP